MTIRAAGNADKIFAPVHPIIGESRRGEANDGDKSEQIMAPHGFLPE
jgi:hypothetical protein